MILGIWTGIVIATYVGRALERNKWDPNAILWVQVLIAGGVPAVMIIVLYRLINRLGRSH